MVNKESSTSFYFELSLRGEDVAFQEVTGISKDMGVEEVIGGGENSLKYRLPTMPPNENLILKRALIPEGSLLNDWCASCIDGGLANKIITQDISLSLLDVSGIVYVKWTFHNAYPIKYSISDLKSQENGIIIESIELAYTYFEIAPAPMFGDLFD